MTPASRCEPHRRPALPSSTSTKTQFKDPILHIDGDAWADVLVDGNLKSTTRVGTWRDEVGLEARDLNGDGRADLVRRYQDGGKRVAEVWLSDGIAFEQGWRGPSDAICVAQR